MAKSREGPKHRRRRRMEASLDRYLIGLVTKGRPMVDSEGFPCKDADGKEIYKPPSAADLSVIARRLKDLQGDDDTESNQSVASIMRDLRERGHDLHLAGGAEDDGDVEARIA